MSRKSIKHIKIENIKNVINEIENLYCSATDNNRIYIDALTIAELLEYDVFVDNYDIIKKDILNKEYDKDQNIKHKNKVNSREIVNHLFTFVWNCVNKISFKELKLGLTRKIAFTFNIDDRLDFAIGTMEECFCIKNNLNYLFASINNNHKDRLYDYWFLDKDYSNLTKDIQDYFNSKRYKYILSKYNNDIEETKKEVSKQKEVKQETKKISKETIPITEVRKEAKVENKIENKIKKIEDKLDSLILNVNNILSSNCQSINMVLVAVNKNLQIINENFEEFNALTCDNANNIRNMQQEMIEVKNVLNVIKESNTIHTDIAKEFVNLKKSFTSIGNLINAL